MGGCGCIYGTLSEPRGPGTCQLQLRAGAYSGAGCTSVEGDDERKGELSKEKVAGGCRGEQRAPESYDDLR